MVGKGDLAAKNVSVEKKSPYSEKKCISERIQRISVEQLKQKAEEHLKGSNKSKSISGAVKAIKSPSDQD